MVPLYTAVSLLRFEMSDRYSNKKRVIWELGQSYDRGHIFCSAMQTIELAFQIPPAEASLMIMITQRSRILALRAQL